MFISSAFAQTVAQESVAQSDTALRAIVQFIFIFFILYWFLIRPQRKRIKQHEADLNAIVTGSTVLIAGIEGKVTKVLDAERLEVEIAPHTTTTVYKAYISEVIKK